MGRNVTVCLVICFILSAACSVDHEPQERTGLVNDHAGIMEPDNINLLEDVLSEFTEKTGVEIVVVTVNNMHGIDRNTYTETLFSGRSLGSNTPNGVLLMLFDIGGERLHLKREYGIETIITDAKAKTISDQFAANKPGTGEYEKYLLHSVVTAMKIVAEDQGYEMAFNTFGGQVDTYSHSSGGPGIKQFFLILLAVLLLVCIKPGRTLIMFVISKIGIMGGGNFNGSYSERFDGGFSTSSRFGGFGGPFSKGGRSKDPEKKD